MDKIMKSAFLNPVIILISVLLISPADCVKKSTGKNNPSDQIEFTTDKLSYAKSDTVHLSIHNCSIFNKTVGLRCGSHLEMFYQKWSNNGWGDSLQFAYMSLRCPTLAKTIDANTIFSHSITAEMFQAAGTFRLVVDIFLSETGTKLGIVSNTFEIR